MPQCVGRPWPALLFRALGRPRPTLLPEQTKASIELPRMSFDSAIHSTDGRRTPAPVLRALGRPRPALLPEQRRTGWRARASHCAVWLFAALAAAARGADKALVVEGESVRGLRTVPLAEAEGGAAALFQKDHHSVEIPAPGPLPQGPIWAKARLRLADSRGPTQIALSLEGAGLRDATVSLPQFAWFRVAGACDGRTAPKLRLDFKDGPDILLDQIVFEPARDALSLPAPSAIGPKARIVVMAADSEAARAEAESLRGRLGGLGASVGAVAAEAEAPQPAADSAYLLCCGEWDEPAALRFLPDWSAQPAAAEASWVYKPAGVFGAWAALGVRAGGAESVPDTALARLLGRSAEGSVSALKAASPSYFHAAAMEFADALAGRSEAALGAGLASPYAPVARGAADPLLQWIESPETLGPFPSSKIDWLAAALGNWLYRAEEWGLSPWDRALYGEMFARLAGLAEGSLETPGAPEGQKEILSPAQVRLASGLYWAGRGLGAEAPGGDPARWLTAAGVLLGEAPQRALAESMRGRIVQLRDVWDFFSQTGGPEGPARRFVAGVEALKGGPDKLCAFGDERPFFSPAETEGLALPLPIRLALSAEGRSAARLQRLDLPPQAVALSGSPEKAPFDKIVLRGAQGSLAVLDGLSGGPDGYADAGAILRYADADRLWVGGPGPGAPDARSQNGLTLSLDAQRLDFLPLAGREAELAGQSSSLAVALLRGEAAGQWRRAVFAFDQPPALAVVDRAVAGRAGRADAVCRWRVLGKAQSVSAEQTRLEQNGAQADVWLLGAGEKRLAPDADQSLEAWRPALKPPETVSILRQRWIGPLRADEEIVFGAVFAPASGGSDATVQPVALAAGGIRIGPGAAALAGPVNDPALRFEGTAACISPSEILLAGARSLACGPQWIVADTPVDLALDLAEGSIEATAQRNCALQIRIPAGIELQGAPTQRAGEFASVALATGAARLKLSDPRGLKPLFEATLMAVDSLTAGSAGALPQPLTESADSSGLRLFGATRETKGEILCFAPDETSEGAQRVLFSTQEGAVGWLDSQTNVTALQTLDSPVRQIQAVDFDLNGEAELVVGCADSTVRVLAADGQEMGRARLGGEGSKPPAGAGVRLLLPFDLESDGLPELAVATDDGVLAILDHLGRRRAAVDFRGAPGALAVGDFEGDGRAEILLGTTLGQRVAIRFDAEGQALSADAAPAGSPILSAAFADLDGDGAAEAVFGDNDGTLAAFAPDGGEGFRLKELWRRTLGDEGVVALAAAGSPAAAPLAAASGSGFVAGLGAQGAPAWIEYLDGPVTALAALAPSGEPGGWLAATEAGSLYVLAPEKKLRQRIGIGRAARFIAPMQAGSERQRIFLAAGASIQILDRTQ